MHVFTGFSAYADTYAQLTPTYANPTPMAQVTPTYALTYARPTLTYANLRRPPAPRPVNTIHKRMQWDFLNLPSISMSVYVEIYLLYLYCIYIYTISTYILSGTLKGETRQMDRCSKKHCRASEKQGLTQSRPVSHRHCARTAPHVDCAGGHVEWRFQRRWRQLVGHALGFVVVSANMARVALVSLVEHFSRWPDPGSWLRPEYGQPESAAVVAPSRRRSGAHLLAQYSSGTVSLQLKIVQQDHECHQHP